MPGIVLIGGGLAAARCAINLRAEGYEGALSMVCGEELAPYDRPPLSKSVITDDVLPHPTVLLDQSMARALNVDMHHNVWAQRIDRQSSHVHLSTGEELSYHTLVLATGSIPRPLAVEGAEAVLSLRSYADTLKLRSALGSGKRVIILGGGFIGLELAASARQRGCDVVLLEARERLLMRAVPAPIADIIHKRHSAAGVQLCTDVVVSRIADNTVHLADGRSFIGDVIISGIGAVPNVHLAAEAGLTIENGIACDAELRSSDPAIFACGDCCSFPHTSIGGKRVRFEAWRNAIDQAATVALGIKGRPRPHSSLPWFWSDQYDLSLQVTGFPDEGAQTITRAGDGQALLQFHLTDEQRLIGASGIGLGTAIARDIKLSEMLIAKQAVLKPAALSDSSVPLKTLLKG